MRKLLILLTMLASLTTISACNSYCPYRGAGDCSQLPTTPGNGGGSW